MGGFSRLGQGRYSRRVLLAAAPVALLAVACGGEKEAAKAEQAVLGEFLATVREMLPGRSTPLTTTSNVQILFAPGIGWWMEVYSRGERGERQRISGRDGAEFWIYDPAGKRYVLGPSGGAIGDPRAGLAVMLNTAGTRSDEEAMEALRQLPDVTLTVEGEDVVLGREATVVRIEPYGCGTAVQTQADGSRTETYSCGGYVRSWLDKATGWVVQAEADDGRGGGYTWEPLSMGVGGEVNANVFRFTPPPDAEQVPELN